MRTTVVQAMLLLIALAAVPAVQAQSPSQPLAVEQPVAYLPLIEHTVGSITQQSDPLELQVVRLTNERRAEAGCAPLALSATLAAAARGHSTDMATNDFFSHTGSDGSSPFVRIERAGYDYSRAAENIAAGFSDAESVVLGWFNSPGHRENMLDCRLQEIGVGYVYTKDSQYRHYWTQTFGTP